MKRLLDTNSWIALTVEAHPFRPTARAWYAESVFAAGDLLFCRSTEISYLRLITQAHVMNQCGLAPLTNEEAAVYLNNLYRDPTVSRLDEPPGTRTLWLELSRTGVPSPNVWMDAYLAAFAITAGAELVTFDRGFMKFQPRGLLLRLLDVTK